MASCPATAGLLPIPGRTLAHPCSLALVAQWMLKYGFGRAFAKYGFERASIECGLRRHPANAAKGGPSGIIPLSRGKMQKCSYFPK